MLLSRRTFCTLALATWGTSNSRAIAARGDRIMTSAEESQPQAADGILVPEHFVPTPRTISPEAQAFLSHTAPVGAMRVPASRDDLQGWLAYRKAGDRGILAVTSTHTKMYPADVVTHELSAAKLYELTPRNLSPDREELAIIYVHGGGFVAGGGEAAISSALQMATLARVRVYSVDYRLVPEFAFPAPVHDTLEAYQFVLERHDAKRVAIFGASAGANLAPAAILLAREIGLPLPAACAIHSSLSDMSRDGDTFSTNYMVDTVLRQRFPELIANYANGHDLTDPLLSPVFADFSKGFPPTILTTGTRDMLLSPTVMLHRAMLRGGVQANLHVWEAMTHAPFFGAPEEEELYEEHIRFMLRHAARD